MIGCELAGLHRPNRKLDDAGIHIEPDHGALHEVGGRLSLGPPKTPAAVHDILPPPFLVDPAPPRGAVAARGTPPPVTEQPRQVS